MPGFQRLSIILLVLLSSFATARAGTPPSADQAFQLKVSRDDGGLSLVWAIEPGSYLYRAMIAAKSAVPPGTPVTVQTTRGEPKDDPDFGPQEIYRSSAMARIASTDLRGLDEIVVTYQGCAEQYQICYPPVAKTIDLQTLAMKDRGDAAAASSGSSSPFVDAPDAADGPSDGDLMKTAPTSGEGISYWVSLGGMLAS